MDFADLVHVNIASGEVLANNLRAFWQEQDRYGVLPVNPSGRPPSGLAEVLLAERVQAFYRTHRHRRHHRSWSVHELHQLAVAIALRKQKFQQAAAQLAKSTVACRHAFRQMKKAGVV